MVPAQDEEVTGRFEITVNGKLVHSRKKHGFLVSLGSLCLLIVFFQHNNPAQQKVVFDAVRAELQAVGADAAAAAAVQK